MRMSRCYACSRRRPMRRLTWGLGGEPQCAKAEMASCWRAYYREQAKVCRWILGNHNVRERLLWRERLARHLERARQ